MKSQNFSSLVTSSCSPWSQLFKLSPFTLWGVTATILKDTNLPLFLDLEVFRQYLLSTYDNSDEFIFLFFILLYFLLVTFYF